MSWVLLTQAQGAEYSNPVLAGDFPDPSVIRVEKEFWATATSSEWAPQFPLLHSRDLVNWDIAGPVFPEQPSWAVANFWAPEITAWKGRYYVYYVGRKRDGPLTVAVASADKPQGPYHDHGPIISQPAGSIDPVACDDEQGRRFLIWKEDGNSRRLPTIIWAALLNEDGTKLAGEPVELMRNDKPWEGAVVEGPFVVRRDGWFYLFYSGNGCCGAGCNYALGVARSKSLLGPWDKNPSNPILAGNDAWRCPGHGSIVEDERGRFWLMYHAYSAEAFVFTGRQALLDEVVWAANGWPTINGGKGPSTQAVSPFDAAQQKRELDFRDEFDASVLKPGWNWPVRRQPLFQIENGKLRLTARAQKNDDFLGGLIGRSMPAGDLTATTEIDLSTLPAGALAGLAAVGDTDNATGVAVGNGKSVLWSRIRGQQRVIAEQPTPNSPHVWVRLLAKGGADYRFAVSADGAEWIAMGEQASGKQLPPWDRAMRIALTVGGRSGAEARFEFFEMKATRR